MSLQVSLFTPLHHSRRVEPAANLLFDSTVFAVCGRQSSLEATLKSSDGGGLCILKYTF